MTNKEYLKQISQKEVDSDKVKRVASIYGNDMPEMLQKIISNSEETIFLDDGIRILSFGEIVDAENDLHVEFSAKGMIPMADCGDNDFIVYHRDEKIWSKFNIIDETVFKKKNELDELLK